jgi:hypothetical protein
MITRNQHVILFIDEPWEESRPLKCIYLCVLCVDEIPQEIILLCIEDNMVYCLSPRYEGETLQEIIDGKDIVSAIGQIIDPVLLKKIDQNQLSSINIDNDQFQTFVLYYGIGSLFVDTIRVKEYQYLESWLVEKS